MGLFPLDDTLTLPHSPGGEKQGQPLLLAGSPPRGPGWTAADGDRPAAGTAASWAAGLWGRGEGHGGWG